MLCRQHIAQLREHIGEIRRCGGDLAAIGTGDRAYAAAFAEQEAIDFPLMVDPELVTYRAVDARRAGVATLLRLGQLRKAAAALRRGRRQHRSGPHLRQLGATHVIGPGDEVAYAWINADMGDEAPLDEVVEAVRRAAV